MFEAQAPFSRLSRQYLEDAGVANSSKKQSRHGALMTDSIVAVSRVLTLASPVFAIGTMASFHVEWTKNEVRVVDSFGLKFSTSLMFWAQILKTMSNNPFKNMKFIRSEIATNFLVTRRCGADPRF